MFRLRLDVTRCVLGASRAAIASALVATSPALAAAAKPAATAAVPPPDPSISAAFAVEDPPLYPLAQVKAGQRGKSHTVFSSRQGPEPFDVEILGVMRGFLGPGEDLIIARLIGANIEKTGVISGMSGSPVYIDGKLVGAIGYRFGQFVKDPICGITPIERMLTAKNTPAPRQASRASGSRAAAVDGGGDVALPATPWGQAERIAVPLVASGVWPHVLDAFRPEFARRGYGPVVQGAASGTAADSAPQRFYAGGPIAGLLVDGDISMAGVGTVTWVKGARFAAFGHPFLGTGATTMPVANAEIVTTVPSEAGSWKMGQATALVGALTDDRLHAIAGTMGPLPKTIPLRVRLDLPGPRKNDDAKRELSFRVAKHPTDTPLFMALSVANSLQNRVAVERGGTVDALTRVTLSTGQVVEFATRAAEADVGLEIQIAFKLLMDLSMLVEQDLKDVEFENVEVVITGREAVDRARVVGADLESPAQPGKDATLRVRLQPFQGPIVERRLTVRIPGGTAPGAGRLVVAGAAESARIERELGMLPPPLTFDNVLAAVRALPPPGSLSVYWVQEATGIRLEGQALPDLPPSLQGALMTGAGGGLGQGLVEETGALLARLPDDGVVVGEAAVRTWLQPPTPLR